MIVAVGLPVLLALSWVPASVPPMPRSDAAQTAKAAHSETMTCPLTGEEIPSCCCPAKK